MTTMKNWASLLLAFLLCCCLAPLAPGGGEVPGEPPTNTVANDVAMAMLRGFSDALIQTAGTDYLRKKAPDAIAIFDRPGADGAAPDGVLSLAEVEAVITASSSEELASRLTFVGIMVYGIIESRRAAASGGGV